MKSIVVSLLLALILMVSACTVENDNVYDPNASVDSNHTLPVEPGDGGGEVDDTGKERATARVESAELIIMESYPVQIALLVSGAMPTPCHEFRYEVAEPDAENRIYVEVYSVVAPGQVCVEMEQPFSENIRLVVEGLPDGIYSVYVNGELVGEFSYPA